MGQVNRVEAMGTIPASARGVAFYSLFPHLDGFKNTLCKVQTHPLKSTRSPETLAHKAKTPSGPQPRKLPPSSLSAVVGRCSSSFTMQAGDGAYAGGLSHHQKVPHSFSQPSNQTHLNRGFCSQQPTRHRSLVCSPEAGASPAVVSQRDGAGSSPIFQRGYDWVSSPQTPNTFGQAITQPTLLRHSYCQCLHLHGKTMFRLKATVLLID